MYIPSILVTVDDASLQPLFVKAFKSAGYKIVRVKDTPAAFKQLDEFIPDIMIVDSDCLDAAMISHLAYVKRYNSHMLIVAMGWHDELNPFASIVLQKPITPEALIPAIQHLL